MQKRTHDWRRSQQRFAVVSDLEYKLSDGEKRFGTGRTVNISSKGLLFETRERLPVGSWIQLSIAWPMKLGGNIGLILRTTGKVLRSQDGFVAVSLSSYEFRTRHEGARNIDNFQNAERGVQRQVLKCAASNRASA